MCFCYFCGGHKNNFQKWFRSSFKVFSEFLNHVCFMLVSLHFWNNFSSFCIWISFYWSFIQVCQIHACRARVLCAFTCSRAWRVCVLTCLVCLRAYVLACLACLRACLLVCLPAHMLGVLTCLRAWCAFVRARLLWWNVLFSYVFAYLVYVHLVCFFVLFPLHFNT